jgi:hypothetical protein
MPPYTLCIFLGSCEGQQGQEARASKSTGRHLQFVVLCEVSNGWG